MLTLGLSPRLQRSLATTNAAESLISRTRHVKRNVKRWRGGQMRGCPADSGKVGDDGTLTLPHLPHVGKGVVLVIEVSLQHPEMLVPGDASKVLLGLPECGRRPPQRHLPIPPAGDAPGVLTNAGVRRVDDVGRRQAPAAAPAAAPSD